MSVINNKINLESIKSEKVKLIATSPMLLLKIKALILLESKDILGIFNISEPELEEFKINFFNVDSIMQMGRPYIIDWLEKTKQKELLGFYMNGEDYTKARLGLSKKVNIENIYSNLVTETLLDSVDSKDIDVRLRCIKTLKIDNKNDTVIDRLSEILEGVDI